MSINKVRFKKEWFNPVYFHIRHYLADSKIRRILIYGGKSSAKTFSISQLLVIACHIEKASAILYRKEQTSIKTTLKHSIKKAVETTYMESVWREMDFKFVNNTYGNEIIFKGLDTEGKIKGIEGYKYLLFDELDHFKEEEWRQANISLRGIEGVKLFGTWNPVDENSWIKKMLDRMEWDKLPREINNNPLSKLHDSSFVKLSKDGKTLLIKTNYHDNKWMVGGDGFGFVDQNLIDEYEALRQIDENSYNVNVLGEWGITNKNTKYAWAFSKDKHVKDFVQVFIDEFGVPYNPNRVVWLSFDFNVNPITCTCIQHFDGIVFIFKCFKLENSNTYALCDHIKAFFKPGTVFKVTGDASGANRNTLNGDNMHNYQIIQAKLGIPNQQMFVPTRNPDVEMNQVLLNAVLLNYKVWIQPGEQWADEVIYDLAYVEVDEKKAIKKDRTSDKKNADFLDTVRYFINIEFPDFLKTFKN